MNRLALALALLVALPWAGARGGEPVDLELVIALDVSTSMSARERAIERAGFAEAFRDPAVLRAITAGPEGRVAIVCFVWAGAGEQRVLLPWTVVDGPAAAAALAEALERDPMPSLPHGTATGDALRVAAELLAASPFPGARRVVNIASDGVANAGPEVAPFRAALLAAGVTINAMPILATPKHAATPAAAWSALTARYLEAEVIGGPGAFIEPAAGTGDLVAAVRRKLLREISGPLLAANLD